jgi:hypothetical protein
MIFGVSLHGAAYSYLRGRGRITLANAIQFFDLAAAPCLAFLVFDDMPRVLWATGITWTVVSALVLLPDVLAGRTQGHRRERAELLRYGLPRVPGDLAMGALLTVPVYVAARTHGLAVSGQVGFGATLLNIAGRRLFAAWRCCCCRPLPLNWRRAIMPVSSTASRRIALLSVIASLLMLVLFEALADPLLHVYLGRDYADYVPLSRLDLPRLPCPSVSSTACAACSTPTSTRRGTASISPLASASSLIGGAVHLVVPTPPLTMGVVMVVALYYLGWATWRDVRFVLSELDRLAGQVRAAAEDRHGDRRG